MNKVFKVIWSEARNAYVVVSEIAKNHGSKSCSTKKLLTMLIATGVMTCASMAPAMASNPASDDLNVTIGKGAHVSVWNGVTGKNITGDIAVGPNAHAWNGEYSYGSEGRIGSKEYLLDFGQGGVVGAESFFGIPYKYKVADGSKIAGSIAIGKNTVARTGSVMLGDHSYTGKLGDIEINPANAMTYNDGIYSTTLGAGAYNSGSLAAVTGALSIASGEDTQNTGATIYGSMNSIESATSNSKYSGVASSVLGFANRTQNANATLIWGTGNEVTNSVEKIGIDTDWNNVSVAEAQQKAIEAMQSSKYAGGSVMAIGGGNKADYATYSQLTGVQNKVTGTKAKAAKYDFVNGYQNTVTEASDVTVIGSKNEVTADGNKVIGDNHKVSGKNNVIFGSADKLTETTVNNAVVLGHNAKVTGEGGVALAVGSVADRANAVSVGSTGANRQIINVAAGEADTDAVNVSQLKKATANANKGWKLSTEGGTENQVASEATVDFSGKKDAGGHQNITVSNEGNNVKIELASELKNVTGVVNGNSRVTLGTGIAGITNGQESVIMMNGSTTINGVVGIDNTGKISGVANGEADKDAVNYGQLKDVKAEALKHSTVTNGDNIAVTETTNKDGGKEYKVALNNDIHLFGDNGAMVSISGSHGTIWTSGSVTAGSVVAGDVVMDSTTATVSGLGNKTTAYEGFANGKGKAATEEQLKEVATEAGKHSKVVNGSNINVEEFDNDGQKIYKVNLNKDIMLGDLTGKYVNISGTNGTIETTGYIATKDRVYADKGGKLADIDVTGNKISNGASSIVLDGSNVKVNDKVTINQNGKISGVAAGEVSKTSTDAINGSQLHQTNENVAANRADIDKNKADIAALDNRVTKNEQDIAQNKADIAQNKADIATNKADIATNKANIAQNAADIKKVEELAKKHTTVTAGDNITVTEDTNKDGGKEYNVALKNKIDLGDNGSVTTGQTVMNNDGLKVGKDVSVTAAAVTAGKTSISDEGVKVGDKTYISADGLNANDQKVSNVADGDISATSKDAVNGSQLYKTNQEVANNTNRINKLGSRVNKVGAGAAALAALHPMDFDPDDKLTFSAGYGNYAGENAAAIGAYYRPDEKVMFSVAGTVGNGENMVNAGVSFALDRTNHVSNSRTALAREVIDLRGQLAVMGAKMAKMEKAFGMLDETKTKLFPDVPANHWAYEYIAKLAGNGYIEGYPDGNFGGDRLMTRYEFAAMLYRAIENGAALEEKIIKEFEPELGRIRVDRISGEDGDRDKIERVRVNDTKGERDHYGNKLAK